MAGSRRTQLVDRGVTVNSQSDLQQVSLRSRPRSRSRSRSRSVSRNRDRSRSRSRGRRRIPSRHSPSHSRSLPPRDDDRYRPTRSRDNVPAHSPSGPQHQHYSPNSRPKRKTSRSPRRGQSPPRKATRARSRDRSFSRPRRADSPRRYYDRSRSPRIARDSQRNDRYSPRRRSPDSYIPRSRLRSRSPISSTYRPVESRRPEKSPTSQRRHRHRDASPREPVHHHRPSRHASHSPDRTRRSREERPREKHRKETISKHSRPSRRSTSPFPHKNSVPLSSDVKSYRSKHRPRDQSGTRSPILSKHKEELVKRHLIEDQDMGDRYYNGVGRGGHRPPRPLLDVPYNHTPQYFPPDQMSPHSASSYGGGRGGWAGPYASHQGSPLYPPAPSPYRQASYPPAQSPTYYPSPHHAQFSSSPPYQAPYTHHPYPTQSYRGGSGGNSYASPDRRVSGPGSHTANPPPRRGHFSNLSWTPQTGSRGGVQIPPKTRAQKDAKSESAEEEENPFRPAKDLRAEDESANEKKEPTAMAPPTQPVPNKPEPPVDNKIKFAMKSKPAAAIPARADLSQMARSKDNITVASPLALRSSKPDVRDDRSIDSRKPDPDRRRLRDHDHVEPRKPAKKLVKRIRPKAVLSPDLATSESVYYRKPGNESVVGSGTYGKVFRAIHVYTGNKVALKKIRMEGERDGFPVTAIREVKLLQSLNHDNVVQLQEVMVEKNDCYMVFEYLSHDLTGLLNHPTFKLDDGHKKHLAQQLFDGLDYLHRRGVLHRDIKAANILISNTGQLKLADFGLARFFAKRRQLDYTNRVITIWYRSPELLLGETQYGPAVDIWSAACVLVEIFTRHAIFPGDGGEINQLDKIYNVLGTPTRAEWPAIVDMAWFELLRPSERKASTFAEKFKDRVTPEAFELLQWMFAFDPQQRPSAAEVLEHPYFTKEEPASKRAVELKDLQGDWHEFESKALRKERERVDREARKAKEVEAREGKRKLDGNSEEREIKKLKVDSDTGVPGDHETEDHAGG